MTNLLPPRTGRGQTFRTRSIPLDDFRAYMQKQGYSQAAIEAYSSHVRTILFMANSGNPSPSTELWLPLLWREVQQAVYTTSTTSNLARAAAWKCYLAMLRTNGDITADDAERLSPPPGERRRPMNTTQQKEVLAGPVPDRVFEALEALLHGSDGEHRPFDLALVPKLRRMDIFLGTNGVLIGQQLPGVPGRPMYQANRTPQFKTILEYFGGEAHHPFFPRYRGCEFAMKKKDLDIALARLAAKLEVGYDPNVPLPGSNR